MSFLQNLANAGREAHTINHLGPAYYQSYRAADDLETQGDIQAAQDIRNTAAKTTASVAASALPVGGVGSKLATKFPKLKNMFNVADKVSDITDLASTGSSVAKGVQNGDIGQVTTNLASAFIPKQKFKLFSKLGGALNYLNYFN